MNKVIQSGLVLAVLFISNVVSAGTISESSLNKLMVSSGLNKQIAQFPAMVGVGMVQARQQGAAIPDAEFSEIQKSIAGAFQLSAILKMIGKEIKNNVSESDAKQLLTWYKSSLGKKITKAEEDSSTPAAYQEMVKQAQPLFSKTKRVQLAKEIDSLINATDMTMQLQENTGVAVFTAISSAMNPGKPVNIKPYMDQLSAQKPQMRANIEQLVVLTYIYSYKDIDIASIKKYITFLKRTNTKKFNDSVIKGMVSGLNQSIDKMANSLAKTFKKNANKK